MIAFFVALLLAVLGHGPMPQVEAPALSAAHAVQTPAPRAVAPTPSHGRASADGAPPGVPVQRSASSATVVPSADVAEQLPEEIIGRQVDCPDGQVGTVVDAAGDVHCP